MIGTISRLAPTQAHLQIQISGSYPVPESSEEFTGVIRLADIRLTERDKIKMGECFRLGDLVKAKVVGTSSIQSYSPSPRIVHELCTRDEMGLDLGTGLLVISADGTAITRRRSIILPLNSGQRTRGHLGKVRIRECDGTRFIPGYGGYSNRKDREA